MRQRQAALATLLLLGVAAALGRWRLTPADAPPPAAGPPARAPAPVAPRPAAAAPAAAAPTDGVVEILLPATARFEQVVPPCWFVQQPAWETFETRVYPRLFGGQPRLPVPPRWARRALEGVGLRPASVGQIAVGSPWLSHLALRTQISWDNADGLDRYADVRGDPAAEAAWWDSLHEPVQEDPALRAALVDHPDPALRDLMALGRFDEDLDPWTVVGDQNADPLLRQAALARACQAPFTPPAAELAPLFDGASPAFAMGLAAAALTAHSDPETFAWFEREALACRAAPPGDPDPHPVDVLTPFGWARTDGCPNDDALAAIRGQLVALGRATARDWQEALHAAASACDLEEAPDGRSTATWRAGWRFDRDDAWFVCLADHHVDPAPPEGTRIAVTVLRWTSP